jgi:hypothetical protein
MALIFVICVFGVIMFAVIYDVTSELAGKSEEPASLNDDELRFAETNFNSEASRQSIDALRLYLSGTLKLSKSEVETLKRHLRLYGN